MSRRTQTDVERRAVAPLLHFATVVAIEILPLGLELFTSPAVTIILILLFPD